MMMMPAARSKSRLSGILTMEFAGSAIFSRAPLWPQDATTRSPTFRSVTPAPMLSITPATSAAGENGNGGLIWYLPWIIKRSKKFSAADLMAITTWPASATGSGTSVSTRSSGPQYCEQRMAFMDTPGFRTHKEAGRFLPDLKPGDNTIEPSHSRACDRTRVYPSSAISLSKSATADLDVRTRNLAQQVGLIISGF